MQPGNAALRDRSDRRRGGEEMGSREKTTWEYFSRVGGCSWNSASTASRLLVQVVAAHPVPLVACVRACPSVRPCQLPLALGTSHAHRHSRFPPDLPDRRRKSVTPVLPVLRAHRNHQWKRSFFLRVMECIYVNENGFQGSEMGF